MPRARYCRRFQNPSRDGKVDIVRGNVGHPLVGPLVRDGAGRDAEIGAPAVFGEICHPHVVEIIVYCDGVIVR